jgi:hypothetical protein
MNATALEQALQAHPDMRLVDIADDTIGIVVDEWDGLGRTALAAGIARAHGGRVTTITTAGPGMLVLIDRAPRSGRGAPEYLAELVEPPAN